MAKKRKGGRGACGRPAGVDGPRFRTADLARGLGAFRRRKKRERRCSRPWSRKGRAWRRAPASSPKAKVSEMGRALSRVGVSTNRDIQALAKRVETLTASVQKMTGASKPRAAPRSAERHAHGKTMTARSATGPGAREPRACGGPRRGARSTSRPRPAPWFSALDRIGAISVEMARPPQSSER